RDQLVEPVNAAADLKKLHDLSPQDQSVMDELAGLLMELNDYKSLVQLYEDQILRGKDMNARAELARKVARIWEEQLTDGREAADAWRRVMRMKAADPEATQGLERSKSGALKKPEGDPKVVYAPPKLVSEQPVPPPARAKEKVEASVPPAGSSPSNGPKRPSSPRISVSPRGPSSASEATSTRTAPTRQVDTPQMSASAGPPSSKPPRSVPPPLPSHALKDTGSGLTTTMASPVKPRSGAQDGSALESEIDASLDRLELEGPTGTTLPGELPSPSKDGVPSTLDAPGGRGTRPPVTFNENEEATQSAQVVPHTLRDSFRVSRDPLATERPVTTGDSSLSESFHPPPVTVPPVTTEGGPTTNPEGEHGINEAPTGESAIADEELGSGELLEADDATGAGIAIDQLLESTLARSKRTGDLAQAGQPTEDDEIVIADDLAEDIDDDKGDAAGDDDEEHTDAGATVPPFRPGS
ncbi:MAG: Adventurous gliding motility protein, partial [Myxococcaceae bacterium]|nr:Adventurous gliding motility protein [Myxococcaceae bacterium]